MPKYEPTNEWPSQYLYDHDGTRLRYFHMMGWGDNTYYSMRAPDGTEVRLAQKDYMGWSLWWETASGVPVKRVTVDGRLRWVKDDEPRDHSPGGHE